MIQKQLICDDEGIRLDLYLSENNEDLSRNQIQKIIKEKKVFVNNKIEKSSYKVSLNDEISYSYEEDKNITLEKNKGKYEIVFENDSFLIINKPQGLTVHPSDTQKNNTLVNALLFDNKKLSNLGLPLRPGIVHRIDKNTSGLLCVAKTDKAYRILQEQIQEKIAKRKYLAILSGNVKEDSGVIHTFISRDKKNRKIMSVSNSGKEAITNYKVIERLNGNFTFCEFILDTGRTHQIRVHSKYLNHPIIGDDKYGGDLNFKLEGQCLHAYELSLNDPETNKEITFRAKLPQYFVKILKKLKSNEVINYE